MDTSEIRSIKTLIKKAFIFIIIFAFLDLLIPLSLFKSVDYFGLKSKYVLEGSDILVLGASHTADAISPFVFEKKGISVYNSSRSGQFPEFNYYFYNKYKKSYGAPKIVIISTPYLLFSESSKELLFYLFSFGEFKNYFIKNTNLLEPNFFKYRSIFQSTPLYINRLFTKKNTQIKNGYTPKKSIYEANDNISNYKTSNTDYSKEFSIKLNKNKMSLKFFKLLLKELEKDNVKIYLVETPEYITTKNSIKNKKMFYDELFSIYSKHDNITFLSQELFTDIDPANNTLFADAGANSHLSQEGSYLFSKQLSNIILGENKN